MAPLPRESHRFAGANALGGVVMDQRITRDNEHGVGALLRATRQRCGEDLRNVARVLRIRLFYLEAIEAGRYADLPGPAYAVGFVRAYADHLGLDGAEVVRRFKSETATAISKPRLAFPVPVTESSIPTGAIVFVGALIAVVAYGAWYLGTAKDNFLASVVAPLPDRLVETIKGRDGAVAPSDVAVVTRSPASATAASRSPDPATGEVAKGESVTLPTPLAAPTAADSPGQATAASDASSSQSRSIQTTAIAPALVDSGSAPSSQPAVEPAPPASPVVKSELAEREAASTAVTIASVETESRTGAFPDSASTPSRAVSEPESMGSTANAERPAPPDSGVSVSSVAPSAAADSATATPSVDLARAEPKTKPLVPSPAEKSVTSSAVASAPTSTEFAPARTATDVAAVPPAEGGVASSAVTSEPAARILVRAKTNSWIQVRDDAANQLLLTRLLRAGDIYRVPDRVGLKLLTGNAGGIEITVDGEPVPSIGPVGAVRRGVALDAEKLKSGTAVTE